jgi:hypothetical protein
VSEMVYRFWEAVKSMISPVWEPHGGFENSKPFDIRQIYT